MTMDKPREACGVFGVYGAPQERTAHMIYAGLFALQHRGQESCGICVNQERDVRFFKEQGRVQEVFTEPIMRQLVGGMGIGHVRHGDDEQTGSTNAQPLVTRYRSGPLAIAHNGSLSNAAKLHTLLEEEDVFLQTTSDAEVMLHMITREFRIAQGKIDIEEAILRAMEKLRGANSVVLMSGSRLMAFRDPAGMRPLCIGKAGDAWVVASESCALDAVEAELVRDVEPGELVVIGSEGLHSHRRHCGSSSHMCIFEYIYNARSDSVIDGQSVYEARREAGRILARSHPVQADLVIGVPDSGMDAARGYAEESGIPLGRGLVINRYVGRTFILPGQENREAAVRLKMNVIRAEVTGKRIVIVEDSIVRGTTTSNLARLLKEAGAAQVHMRISSPPYMWPCYFGTDTPSREQLLANQYSLEEIRRKIGVDSLEYIPVQEVTGIAKDAQCGFCDACFSGKYPVELE